MKSGAKSLWSGHDLHLMKEAQPQKQPEKRPTATPEPSLVTPAPQARILPELIAPVPIDAPAAVRVRAKPKALRVQAPAAKSVPSPTAAAIPDPVPGAPLGLRDKTEETLPRGQRWKRRLPKVIW